MSCSLFITIRNRNRFKSDLDAVTSMQPIIFSKLQKELTLISLGHGWLESIWLTCERIINEMCFLAPDLNLDFESRLAQLI